MRSRSIATLLLAASLSIAAAGCRNGRNGRDERDERNQQSSAAPRPLPAATDASAAAEVILHVGARAIPIRVELARTEAERERGLMFRNHLDPDTGMLFLFPRPGPLTFWMKNTLIPLDMIFIDGARRIIGIVEEATPETETPRRVEGDSQFVLEIAGGLSKRLGVTSGSEVEFRHARETEVSN